MVRTYPLRVCLIVPLLFAIPLTDCRAAYQDVVLADNPIAYWRLDEISGSTAVNLGSLLSTGNATYRGSHTKGESRLVGGDGNSVLFSGGRVSPGHTNGINRSGPFTQKTIELWFRANSLVGRQVLYEQGGGTRGLVIYLDDADLYVAGWNRANDDGGGLAAPWGNSPFPVYVSLPNAVTVDTTNHVVLVMDGDASGTTGTLTGYFNGISFGQQTGVGRLWNHNPAEVGAARSSIRFHDNNTSTNNRDFDGRIDEVALYNTALTASQILYHFEEGQLDSELVGHWKLDEIAGTTASDSSNMSHDGDLLGGVAFGVDSQPSCVQAGSALGFDGADDRIEVASSPGLQMDSELSITGWVRAESFAAAGDVNSVLSKGASGPYNYHLAIEDRRIALYLDSSLDSGFIGETVLKPNRWYHVAATWDGSEVRLFVNGVMDHESPYLHASPLSTDSRTLFIGGLSGTGQFHGLLDDIRLYQVALSPSAIADLYGLVGYWKFDEEGSDSQAQDASGHDYHADLLADATWTEGKIDNAIEFDGIGDRAETIVDFPPPAEGAVAFWMKSAGVPSSRQRIFGLGGDWEVRHESWGGLTFDLNGEGGGSFETTASVAGAWHFIVANFDSASDSFEVFVDGAFDQAGTTSLNPQSANPLSFGTRTGSSQNWEGTLDDVRIFNRQLCPEEIEGLYGDAASSGLRIIRWVEVR